MFSSTLKWIENVKSLPNSQSRIRRTLTIESSLFISFHSMFFCFKATGYRLQHIKVNFFNRVCFLFHFSCISKLLEKRLKLDFWLGNKIIARAKGFRFEFLIDRKRGSIDNIYRSAATMCMAQNEQSGEAKMVVRLHFASRYIDIATSMLACTNYRLIIKLTASTRMKEKTVLCIAQFKLSGWIFDSRSISTFYPQIMQSCTQSANWAKKKSCRYIARNDFVSNIKYSESNQ